MAVDVRPDAPLSAVSFKRPRSEERVGTYTVASALEEMSFGHPEWPEAILKGEAIGFDVGRLPNVDERGHSVAAIIGDWHAAIRQAVEGDTSLGGVWKLELLKGRFKAEDVALLAPRHTVGAGKPFVSLVRMLIAAYNDPSDWATSVAPC